MVYVTTAGMFILAFFMGCKKKYVFYLDNKTILFYLYISQLKTNKMNIAETILDQIGGNKFIVMTGSKNFLNLGNGLRMKLTRNKSKAQYLKIELNACDTYTMNFFSARSTENDIIIKKH